MAAIIRTITLVMVSQWRLSMGAPTRSIAHWRRAPLLARPAPDCLNSLRFCWNSRLSDRLGS